MNEGEFHDGHRDESRVWIWAGHAAMAQLVDEANLEQRCIDPEVTIPFLYGVSRVKDNMIHENTWIICNGYVHGR